MEGTGLTNGLKRVEGIPSKQMRIDSEGGTSFENCEDCDVPHLAARSIFTRRANIQELTCIFSKHESCDKTGTQMNQNLVGIDDYVGPEAGTSYKIYIE